MSSEWDALRYEAQPYLRLPTLREPRDRHQRSNPHHDASTGQFSSGGGGPGGPGGSGSAAVGGGAGTGDATSGRAGPIKSERMSMTEYSRRYEVEHERATSSGITAVVMTNGDMQIRYDRKDDPHNTDVLFDLSVDYGREVGEALVDMADVVDEL